jgi:outer membrane protein assembly factor BamB
MRAHRITSTALCWVLAAAASFGQAAQGWLSWRGPDQNGSSGETDLIEKIELDGEGHLWSYPLAGRGTPVIADGRVYTLGYEGSGPDLQILIVCLDEANGEKVFERRYNDFLSDNIYSRYSIGSPVVDPATANVYFMTGAGLLVALTADGEELWEHDLMAEFGRLTFPNGRTGAPVIDDDLVILHGITAHWGPQGPARDRFYAFDKLSGACVWGSTPGVRPYDSSFSTPALEWRAGKRVFYATTGCGNVVGIDARTGDPLWRFQLAAGGLSSTVALHGDHVIAVNGTENVDTSNIGRMVSLELGAAPSGDSPGPVVLDSDSEAWRNDLVSFTSSPVVVGNRLYQTVAHGDLVCVDVETGKELWHEKLAPDQIHASPLWADGKLYVPMNNGSFYIIRPSDESGEVLQRLQLEGNCLGAPAVANGRIYVHTTDRLYCFGKPGEAAPPWPERGDGPEPGPAVRLQIVPADVVLHPGERTQISVRSLDANGQVVAGTSDALGWKVPENLDLRIDETGSLVVPKDGRLGVGVLGVSAGELKGSARIRVAPIGAYAENFDGFELSETRPDGAPFAYPPGHMIGVRSKWEVRELDGNKVLAKTLDVPLFQRALGFIGHPEMSNYTMQVDILSDGNRRIISTAGVVHQRYMIQLKGNHQELEISSNMERIKESVPFKWKPGEWYTLKTRVDVADDGSGVVRAKAWKRGDPEPETWNIEVRHKQAHTRGAPGLFGFAMQSRFRVYLDNIQVTPNDH